MSRMRRSLSSIPRYERLIAGFLIGAYLVLATRFSLGPIFEGSDEYKHYNYITLLAETRSLPTPAIIQAHDQGAMGEFHQAILYYLVTAPVIALAGNDNKNVFIHCPGEGLPSSGFARTVHLIRLLSVVFGLGTVLTSYAIFWLLWPRRPDIRLLALGFICFMPQFLFQSGMVSNDNLSYVLITLALLLTLVQVKQGPSWKLAVGLGLLTKLSAAFMVFPVGLAVLLDRRSWRYAVVTVILVVLIAGWWYVRNWHLYGEPTGAEILYEYSALAEKIGDGSFDLGLALDRVPYAYRTLWAQFLSVPVAPALYRIYDGLVVLALVGIVLRAALALRSARFDRQQATFAAIVAVFALALVGVFGVLAGLALFKYYLPAYAVADVPAALDAPAYRFFDSAGDLFALAEPQIARTGAGLEVCVQWRAERTTLTDYILFVHLLDADGSSLAQSDGPAGGEYPTGAWARGEIVAQCRAQDDPDLPADARLALGLYRLSDSARLAVRPIQGKRLLHDMIVMENIP